MATASASAKPAESCRVSAPAQVRLDVGGTSEFFVALVPADGNTVSAAGPLRVSISAEPEEGVEVRRSQLRRRHAADPTSTAPRFPVSLQALQPGQYAVEVMASFWLCRASLCRPIRREVSVPVVVSEPPPPPPAESGNTPALPAESK